MQIVPVERNNTMSNDRVMEIRRLNQAIAKLRAELETAKIRADVIFLRQEIAALTYERNIATEFSVEP
jgi:cell division protein FtsB